MTPAAEALREHLRSIYAPIDRRTVTEWCADEVILSERQTQMPGSFSTRMYCSSGLRDRLFSATQAWTHFRQPIQDERLRQ